MRANRLGCLTGTGIISALIAVLAIAGTAFTSGGLMFNPGPLNSIPGAALGGASSHADIAGECHLCHAAPWDPDTMNDLCVVCHTDVPAQMVDISTAHGRMMKIDPAAQCRDCHPEHRGSQALLTELDGWRYPHETSGYFLNAHRFTAENAPFKCADCHAADVTVFDVKVCASCHGGTDAAFTMKHVGSFGASCLDCHDGLDSLGRKFTHDKFAFKLTGGHLVVACEGCHAGARSLADFKTAPQDCVSCHGNSDPHGGALGPDCASCHVTDAWKPANFDHGRTAFQLTGAHAAVACAKCHVNSAYKGTPKDCFSCHNQDDHHQGQLGTDCAACHKPTQWQDITFDHSSTTFPLIGRHSSVTCANCHKNNLFKGTPVECASCHNDVHLGQFGKECSRCHTPEGWKPAHFDHNLAAFKLTGAHVQVDCKLCHVNGQFKGTPTNCFACHAAKDVHAGQFGTDCGSCHNPGGWKNVSFDHSKTALPLSGAHTTVACASCHVNGVFKGTPTNCFACHAAKDAHAGQFGTDCGSCHNSSGWKNVSFDHSKTAFPLSGAHTTVACKACHVNGQYKGTPKDCYSCHAAKDAHAGQFGTNCGSCHKPTQWTDVIFDHNNTAFPLVAAHARVACQACHVNGQYKGTPKGCYSCHAAKDAHGGQFGTDCGSCHKPTQWTDVTFNHNNTAFPLTGMHTTVACQSCHVNGQYKGTPTDCYSCHAAKDAHAGQFGTNCGLCHNTGGWKPATFDHNLTAFPLVGHHVGLECQKCHANGIYAGTPSQCIACHTDVHNGANGIDCSICHTPNDWGQIE